MSLKRIIGGIIVLIAIALVIVAIVASRRVPKVQAASCTDATLDGGYAGYSFGTSGGAQFNNLMAYTFNGSGGFTWEAWSMLNGNFSSNSGSGTYSINANCTGLFTIGSYNWYAVLNTSGNEVDLIEDAPSNNFSQIITKQ